MDKVVLSKKIVTDAIDYLANKPLPFNETSPIIVGMKMELANQPVIREKELKEEDKIDKPQKQKPKVVK